MKLPLRISCKPEELDEGLFGMVFYHAFQVLPYLYAQKIFPKWELRTKHYGDPPDFLTIPGVLDLTYDPPEGPYRTLSLFELRRRHAHVLGNDWVALNRIWNAYFKVPRRVLEQADAIFPQGKILGIHYRGTDKQTTSWDSNPISQQQFLILIRDFLAHRGDFDVIFAATDEYSFVEQLRRSTSLQVISLGEVEFHLAAEHTTTRAEKADRAMLDCVLLSRCQCVLETSSALPSFAKLLNPALEIYRCAASKLFGKLYTKTPYFPVAQIPILPVRSAESTEILRRTMDLDWTYDLDMKKYQRPFAALPRWPINHAVFSVAEKPGLDKLVARVAIGHH
jgi:hypothetical protein